MTFRVLVADPISHPGIAILERYAVVVVQTGQSPGGLIGAIGDYDALVVRSETRVAADVIAAGARLQVIGRAGVGVGSRQ